MSQSSKPFKLQQHYVYLKTNITTKKQILLRKRMQLKSSKHSNNQLTHYSNSIKKAQTANPYTKADKAYWCSSYPISGFPAVTFPTAIHASTVVNFTAYMQGTVAKLKKVKSNSCIQIWTKSNEWVGFNGTSTQFRSLAPSLTQKAGTESTTVKESRRYINLANATKFWIISCPKVYSFQKHCGHSSRTYWVIKSC